MTINEVIQKIERYLERNNVGPLIVDVQNQTDREAIVDRYRLLSAVSSAVFDSASNFCKPDEFPAFDRLINRLTGELNPLFITELSTFYMLKGATALAQMLKEILALNNVGLAVVLTYQCAPWLQDLIQSNKRLETRICILDGEPTPLPKVVFISQDAPSKLGKSLQGIQEFAKAVETDAANVVYLETAKTKASFPDSLIDLSDLRTPYQLLCAYDKQTQALSPDLGTDAEWRYALSEFQTHASWRDVVESIVGDVHKLHVPSKPSNATDSRWLWLYFVALKLFGAENNPYLENAVRNSSTAAELTDRLYRAILETDPQSDAFEKIYAERKALLNALGNPNVDAFCRFVLSKEKNALHYLTDNTKQEKEMVLRLLDKYGALYEKEELLRILRLVYPDLHDYLQPYRFPNAFLDDYFQDYKYQKAINKIFPEFLDVVEREALDRRYNALPPRSSLVEALDKTKTQTFFTDALGVEYLSFISARCRALKLTTKITVCRSELPSITSCNKTDIWDALDSPQFPIRSVDEIDKIKHHGKDGYDYSRADKKLPIHLIRELEIIDQLLKEIKNDLNNAKYDKAILISDHGASRLAVIHETENLWEMKNRGEHSGRCCLKDEFDDKPDRAVDAGKFWALASYDRFKGSRRANVEAHGGATLEEVLVPIIEITRQDVAPVEVRLVPLDAVANLADAPEITVSHRKPAALKIFVTPPHPNVSIELDSRRYVAAPLDEYFHIVEKMPEIRRAKRYSVNVYADGILIAENLPLIVKKESGSERNIL